MLYRRRNFFIGLDAEKAKPGDLERASAFHKCDKRAAYASLDP